MTRNEIIKLIADGMACGGHYDCGAMDDDLRYAAVLLDEFLQNPDASAPEEPPQPAITPAPAIRPAVVAVTPYWAVPATFKPDAMRQLRNALNER